MDLSLLGQMAEESEILPETFHFLNLGWWIVHLVGTPLVFCLGYAAARCKCKTPTAGGGSAMPAASTASEEDS